MGLPKFSQLVVNSSLMMVARVGGSAMAFFTQVIIARSFGADPLGQLALALASANILACVIPLGFHSITVFYVSEYNAAKRYDLVLGFINTSYQRIKGVGAPLVVMLIVVLWYSDGLLSPEKRLPLIMGMLSAPALALIYVNTGIAIAFRRYFIGTLTDTLYKPGFVLVCFGLLALIVPTASAVLVLVVMGATLLVVALIQWWFLANANLVPANTKPTYELTKWQSAAWPWLAIALLSEFFVDIDIVFVSALLSPTDIAVLNACFRIQILFGFCQRAVYNLILPDVYEAFSKGDSKSVQHKFSQASFVALAFTSTALVVVFLFGEFVLGLFGQVFRSGHTTLIILVASLVFRAAFGPTTIALTMRGFQTSAVWVLLISIVIFVILNILLVPTLGIEGAALAAAGYYVFLSIGLWWQVRRKTGSDVSVFALLSKRSRL